MGSKFNRELRLESLRSRFSDPEVVTSIVRLSTILGFQVLHDDFIRYISATGHEVPPCPEMPSPELFLDVLKLHHQFPRTLALDILHDLAGRQVRRARHQDVDMVPGYGSSENFNLGNISAEWSG